MGSQHGNLHQSFVEMVLGDLLYSEGTHGKKKKKREEAE